MSFPTEKVKSTVRQALTNLEAREYSGRGMFGQKCLGVVGSSTGEVVLNVIDSILGEVEFDDSIYDESVLAYVGECISELRGMRTDSMGLDTIVYWPNIAPESVSEEEDMNT